MLSLIVTFAVCWMTGAIFLSNHKLSKSTLTWYLFAVICSIPSFYQVISAITG